MKVFHVSGARRFYGLCLMGLLALAMGDLSLSALLLKGANLIETGFLDLLCAFLITLKALEVFVQRVVVHADRIQSYDALNRPKPPLSFEQMTTYSRSKAPGEWILTAGTDAYPLQKIDKQQFHSVMADKAPHALHAKLWKCGQLPPSQDCENLSAFDARWWLNYMVGSATVGAVFALFSRFFGIFYFVSSFVQSAYHLKDLLGRVDLTAEGVQVRWPWRQTAIAWEELTAVFCEKSVGGSNFFVLTAPERSIVLSSQILEDPEVRRKFFYSIPDRTRCVSFDQKIRFRKRGRGKRIAVEDGIGALEPHLT